MKTPAPHATHLTSLGLDERLKLLRAHDHLRTWTSLNDVRTCICCGRKLTGRRLQIWACAGEFVFRCPTPDCAGELADFVMSGDPFLDETVWDDWQRTIDRYNPAPAP
jgi:hypothetical protein